jgi:hypothetical protein
MKIAYTRVTIGFIAAALLALTFFPVALQPLPGLGLLLRFRNLSYTYAVPDLRISYTSYSSGPPLSWGPPKKLFE